METFTLLLIALTVSVHSYVLQPSLTVTEVGLFDINGTEEVEGTQTLESHTRRFRFEKAGGTLDRFKNPVVTDKPRHKVGEEEEMEGMLVAGLHLRMANGENDFSQSREDKEVSEELGMETLNNEKHEVAEQSRDYRKVATNLPPQTWLSNRKPTTASPTLVSTQPPSKGTSFPPFEELNSEGLQSQTTPKETTEEVTLEPATTHSKSREPVHTHKSTTYTLINMTESAGSKNRKEGTAIRNKSLPAPPHVTKDSVEVQLAAVVASSVKQVRERLTSEEKNADKLKEKKQKKENRTQMPAKTKGVAAPTHFPYFLDDYCPPECACYGRVVQCSDKRLESFPYGIPYNSRYILLMNNRISSIQLDLLDEYESMEFLVLSNNRLTIGAIEGAFEGIPALKRLYLDSNFLDSVPTDLPPSLEELRLDGNQVCMMSEAAWAQCPGLLVLSLSNNSLGNGSQSLPGSVFSPMSKLRTLNLDHNQLTSVPLGLPLSIKELYLRGNHIGQFRQGAFNGVSELMVLDLSANRLSNKGLLKNSLLNATHLESLNLEGNRLKQVPQYLPRSLKTLNLEGNLISSIRKTTLRTLKHLEHLGLARNKIFKVAPGAFKALPVLHQLDLCNNILRQVPRELPQGLHSVVLTHNKIQSVPRDAFCWGDLTLSRLVRVQLEHNLIDMGKLDSQAFRCLRGFQVVHFY